MTKKRVAVICGASVVTSTIIVDKLKKLFEEEGVEAEVYGGLTSQADELAQNADLIVTTAFLRSEYQVPVVNGVSFLTGVGTEKTVRQILKILRK
jgi:PTS system galactitol-specific IIB component